MFSVPRQRVNSLRRVNSADSLTGLDVRIENLAGRDFMGLVGGSPDLLCSFTWDPTVVYPGNKAPLPSRSGAEVEQKDTYQGGSTVLPAMIEREKVLAD